MSKGIYAQMRNKRGQTKYGKFDVKQLNKLLQTVFTKESQHKERIITFMTGHKGMKDVALFSRLTQLNEYKDILSIEQYNFIDQLYCSDDETNNVLGNEVLQKFINKKK
jgi:hypothetical protein